MLTITSPIRLFCLWKKKPMCHEKKTNSLPKVTYKILSHKVVSTSQKHKDLVMIDNRIIIFFVPFPSQDLDFQHHM
jgi:hypothetical protein